MEDFETMTAQLLARSQTDARSRREYMTALSKLRWVQEKGPPTWNDLPLGVVAGSAMNATMAAAVSGIPFKTFKKHVARGDLRAMLKTDDVEQAFRSLFEGLAPPDVAAEARRQFAEQDRRRAELACGAGCWFCCASHKDIAATAAEVEAVWTRIEHMRLGEPLHPNACGALGADGRCAAYEVRPQPCRTFGSTSAEQCRRDLEKSPDQGGETEHIVFALSGFDTHAVTLLLAEVIGQGEPLVDLLTALRELKSGATFDRAIAAARAAHRRFVASGEGHRKVTHVPL